MATGALLQSLAPSAAAAQGEGAHVASAVELPQALEGSVGERQNAPSTGEEPATPVAASAPGSGEGAAVATSITEVHADTVAHSAGSPLFDSPTDPHSGDGLETHSGVPTAAGAYRCGVM